MPPEHFKELFAQAEDNLAKIMDFTQDPPGSHLVDDDEDFMSPNMEAPPPLNPAAHLTDGAAKEMAMEGVTPTSLGGDEAVVKKLHEQFAAASKATPTSKKSAGRERIKLASFGDNVQSKSSEASPLKHTVPEPRLATPVSSHSWESSLRSTSSGSVMRKTPIKVSVGPQTGRGRIGNSPTPMGTEPPSEQRTTPPDEPSPHHPKEITFLPTEQNTMAPTPRMTSPGNGIWQDTGNVHLVATPTRYLEMPDPLPQNDISVLSSPLSPRLFKGRAAIRAKQGRPVASSPIPGKGTGRRELTTPDKIPSRLLQGTSASRSRFSKESHTATACCLSGSIKPIPGRLVRQTKAAEVYLANSPVKSSVNPSFQREVEKAKAKVQQHVKQHKEKELRHQMLVEDRTRKLQSEQIQRRKKMQAAIERARQNKAKHETEEQARREMLKQRLEEKAAQADSKRANRAKENNYRRATVKSLGATASRKPTVPLAPNFRTDLRLKSRGSPNHSKDQPASAKSVDILKQGLGDGKAASPKKGEDFLNRPLTVPKGPRLSTGRRQRAKATPEPKREPKKVRKTNLHAASSPQASVRSTSSRLTIPETPKFQEIRQRPTCKSTAEKEAEEMEYFRSHPLKAKPVPLHLKRSVPETRPVAPVRQVTTPSPFQFATDRRMGDSTPNQPATDEEETACVQLFKARPMPKYSTTTPLTGKRPKTHRPLTTPEPFHFETDLRHQKKTPHEAPEEKVELFKARPMPKFERPTGLTFEFRPKSVALGKTKVDIDTIKFHARAAPKRSPPSIAVRSKDPTKLRHPRKVCRSSPDENSKRPCNPNQFHALPMPPRSPPAIPVRDKNPSKLLWSPRKITDSPQQTPMITFKARQMPDFYKRKDILPKTTIYKGTPTLSSPNLEPQGESPPNSPNNQLAAKDRLRQRLKGRQMNSRRAGVSSAKFSSTSVKNRLQRVAPVASPGPVEVAGRPVTRGVPKSIECSPDKSGAMQGIVPEQARTPRTGTGAGPRSFSTNGYQAELYQQLEASQRVEETMQMAFDLQRAAEDELSFHGSSIGSREQQLGFAEGEYSHEFN